MKPKKLLARFMVWRMKHMPQKQYVLLLSFFVGLMAGLGAVVIKNAVHFIQSFLHNVNFGAGNYIYFAFPIIGILVAVVFIKYVIRGEVGHGIPSTLYAISKKNGIMQRHNMFSSIVTAAFTVGCGGSAGLEGPTVATGSSFGSNIAQSLRLNYKTTTLLLGCGAAGAMAGIFNAPVAAIVFAIEVIMLDLTVSSLIPLLIASVTAAITTWLIEGGGYLFRVELTDKLHAFDIPFYIILGAICGLMSLYFSKMYWWVENQFDRFQNIYGKLIGGGVLLGFLIFLIPPLYGEGYDTINSLLNGDASHVFDKSLFSALDENIYVLLGALILMVFFKVIATSITFGAGGVGGIFAPTLFMGSSIGFIFSRALNEFSNFRISETNFSLVGMAGMISGVLGAPLTAMFLIAEITGGYQLFLPLMITVTISFITVRYFIPHTVYTEQLAKRGELVTHNKDKRILTIMNLKSEIETNFKMLRPNMTLGEVVKKVAQSSRNIFPVVNDNKELIGVVTLDNIREIMFKPELYDEVTVESLILDVPTLIRSDDSMDQVMKKFQDTGAWNLPVINKKGQYVGFVSKSKLFTAYRKLLIHFSED